MGDLDRLDRDVVLGGVHRRPAVLHRQPAPEEPDVVRHVLVVHQDDHAVAALAAALRRSRSASPTARVASPTPFFRRDVGPLDAAGNCSTAPLLPPSCSRPPSCVISRPGALGEAAERRRRRRRRARPSRRAASALLVSIRLITKLWFSDRIACAGASMVSRAMRQPRRRSAELLVISKPLSSRPMRSTMNSNGMVGATPTSTSSSPVSRGSRRVVRLVAADEERLVGRRRP